MMVQPLNLPPFEANIKKMNGMVKILDVLRRRFVALTPEEWVRQHFIHFLIGQKGYSPTLMANEVAVSLNGMSRRCIEQFWLVGKKTAEKMHKMGIHNGAQLREYSLQGLTSAFGKAGQLFYDFARGIDNRPVVTEWVRKSVGCERTYEHDLVTSAAITIELYHILQELLKRLEHTQFQGTTLTLKVKFHDFTQITRSITSAETLTTKEQILPLSKQLMQKVDFADRPIRLLGLSVGNPLQDDEEPPHRAEWIDQYLPFEDVDY